MEEKVAVYEAPAPVSDSSFDRALGLIPTLLKLSSQIAEHQPALGNNREAKETWLKMYTTLDNSRRSALRMDAAVRAGVECVADLAGLQVQQDFFLELSPHDNYGVTQYGKMLETSLQRLGTSMDELIVEAKACAHLVNDLRVNALTLAGREGYSGQLEMIQQSQVACRQSAAQMDSDHKTANSKISELHDKIVELELPRLKAEKYALGEFLTNKKAFERHYQARFDRNSDKQRWLEGPGFMAWVARTVEGKETNERVVEAAGELKGAQSERHEIDTKLKQVSERIIEAEKRQGELKAEIEQTQQDLVARINREKENLDAALHKLSEAQIGTTQLEARFGASGPPLARLLMHVCSFTDGQEHQESFATAIVYQFKRIQDRVKFIVQQCAAQNVHQITEANVERCYSSFRQPMRRLMLTWGPPSIDELERRKTRFLLQREREIEAKSAGEFGVVAPQKWTEGHVAAWLSSLRLDDLKARFRNQAVDGQGVLSLTDEELRSDLAIESSLLRKRLLREIDKLKQRDSETKTG